MFLSAFAAVGSRSRGLRGSYQFTSFFDGCRCVLLHAIVMDLSYGHCLHNNQRNAYVALTSHAAEHNELSACTNAPTQGECLAAEAAQVRLLG